MNIAISTEEMEALRRFHECVTDGEGYDVPKEMMQRLAGIGLVRRGGGAFYEHTTFGLYILGELPEQPAPTAAPAAVSEGELPPLPEPIIGLWSESILKAWAEAMQDYARTAITADRASRATLKSQPAPTEAQGAPVDAYGMFVKFQAWAADNLGQSYSLAMDEHTFIDPVTRWAFAGYRAGLREAQGEPNKQLFENIEELHAAAAAVVARWDTPKWRDEPHTGEFIARLRAALESSGNPGELAQGEDSARLDWLLPNLHPANFGMDFDGGYEWSSEAEFLEKFRAAIDAARATADAGKDGA